MINLPALAREHLGDDGTSRSSTSDRPLTHLLDYGERQAMTKRICSIEGCEKPARSRSFCNAHHLRWLKYGDPTAGRRSPVGGSCSVGGCDRSHEGLGYCKLHRERFKRHGDPLRVEVARWRGDAIGYSGMHDRLRRYRGGAADHPCQHCGEPARDWAYTHDCPNERTSEEGYAYSTDVARYVPLCGSCHQRADKARVKAKGGESLAPC